MYVCVLLYNLRDVKIVRREDTIKMIENVQHVILKPPEEQEQPIVFNCGSLSFFPKVFCSIKQSFYETFQLCKKGIQNVLNYFSSILDALRYFGVVISVILGIILFFMVLGYFLRLFNLVEKVFKFLRLVLNCFSCCLSCYFSSLKKEEVQRVDEKTNNINVNIELKQNESSSLKYNFQKQFPSCPTEIDDNEIQSIGEDEILNLENISIKSKLPKNPSYWCLNYQTDI